MKEESKEKKQKQKQVKKKKLSEALRKNLMRRKMGDESKKIDPETSSG